MKEKAEMAEDENDEGDDDIPWPGPNCHSEHTHTHTHAGNQFGVRCWCFWPYVLSDRLTLANPIAEAPKNCSRVELRNVGAEGDHHSLYSSHTMPGS